MRGVSPPPTGTPPVGTPFTGKTWVELAPGVELQLKHGETTREFSLFGPGRFLVCDDGDESVLVARGKVGTTPGPGSRAGAEVTLATPFGVVEYADAELTVAVGEADLVLDVKHGAASVRASVADDQPGAPPAKPVRGPAGHLVLRGKADAEALAGRCIDARRAVTAGSGPPPRTGPERGQWAVAELAARRTARLACARARAAAGRLEGQERARLESQLTAQKAPADGGTDAGK